MAATATLCFGRLIDAMAAEGVNYKKFYVSSPVCMPNRASLVTCRMPSSHGVRSLGVPLSHDNVTFVDLLRAAGYDTALIGKSHLQTVTSWPVKLDPPVERDGYETPPPELAEAVRSDLDSAPYRYEQDSFYQTENPEVPKPFYGFDEYISVLRHGFNTGGDHELHLRQVAPDVLGLRSRDNQHPHDYSVRRQSVPRFPRNIIRRAISPTVPANGWRGGVATQSPFS